MDDKKPKNCQNEKQENDKQKIKKNDEVPKGPSRQITDINYKKWEDFAENLKNEEKIQEKKSTEEEEYARAVMGGCSHDHSKERQIFEKPTAEKISAADRFRLEGNEAFNSKNYGLAAVNYRKALLQFDYTFPDDDADEKWMNRVKLSCHLNLAACKIIQKDYDEVLIQTRLALEIDKSNCKAFYRQGIAYLHRDEFTLCKENLTKAFSIEPHNQSVKQALIQLQNKIQKYNQRNKKVYKAIFSSNEVKQNTEKKVEGTAEEKKENEIKETQNKNDGGEESLKEKTFAAAPLNASYSSFPLKCKDKKQSEKNEVITECYTDEKEKEKNNKNEVLKESKGIIEEEVKQNIYECLSDKAEAKKNGLREIENEKEKEKKNDLCEIVNKEDISENIELEKLKKEEKKRRRIFK